MTSPSVAHPASKLTATQPSNTLIDMAVSLFCDAVV
jgi:hypothetical protein